MAGDATIGSLKVDLGLDSAQFENGLKSVQSGLGRLQSAMAGAFGKGMGLVSSQVTKAFSSIVGSLGGVQAAVGETINRFDNFSKAASKLGITTESLTQLEYAAAHSNVTFEQMSKGMTILARNMANLASSGGNTARSAFEQLGISAHNADGSLRGTDEVLRDIAQAFSRMEDSTMKTVLATRLLGDDAGATLIPMLNLGAAGLDAMARASDDLGNTLSTSAGRAAEDFNSIMLQSNRAWEGLTSRIVQGALPGLTNFMRTLNDPSLQKALGGIANAIGQGISDIFNFIDEAYRSFNAFTAQIGGLVDEIGKAFTGAAAQAGSLNASLVEMTGIDFGGFFQGLASAAWDFAAGVGAAVINLTGLNAGAEAMAEWARGLKVAGENLDISAWFAGLEEDAALVAQLTAHLARMRAEQDASNESTDTSTQATERATAAAQARAAAEAEAASILAGLRSEEQQLADHLMRLEQLKSIGVLTWEEWGAAVAHAMAGAAEAAARAAEEAADKFRQALTGTLSGISGALTSVGQMIGEESRSAFETAKQFHLASAVAAGAESIVNAFAAGNKLGGMPLGAVWAGLAAVTAAAQIGAVAATSFNSTSISSRATAAAPPPQALPPPAAGGTFGRGVTVEFQGRFWTRDMVEELIREIADLQGDLSGPIKFK